MRGQEQGKGRGRGSGGAGIRARLGLGEEKEAARKCIDARHIKATKLFGHVLDQGLSMPKLVFFFFVRQKGLYSMNDKIHMENW